MAIKTQGFSLSALPRAPQIPGNVGKVDVKEIYDGTRRALESFEMARTALPSMALADTTMSEKMKQLPLQTRGILAQTETAEAQGPIRTRILEQQLQLASDPRMIEAKLLQMRNAGIPMGAREFELLTQGLSPEEKEKARRVHLGLDPRQSSAAIKYMEVVGADGVTRLVAVNPRAVGAEVLGSGQTVGAGGGGPAPSAVAPAVAVEPAVVVDPAMAAAMGGAEAGITPAATVQAAPAVAAPQATNVNLFSSPTIQEQATQKATGEKGAEAVIEARAKLPKALATLRQLEKNSSQLDKDIDDAIANTNSKTAGFGAYFSGVPTSSAKTLAAQLESIKARLGFNELQTMRSISPTGGALGNVSNYEGEQLQSTIARLDQKLDPEILKKFLRRVKEVRREALRSTRDAFDTDVSFYGLTDADFTLQANQAKQPLALPGANTPPPTSGEFKIIEIR